ncbi:MAG: aminotransferase class III-fold pyridoxal phosphate-dependent enzyme, partial [Pirellulales bacterium]|nr:aminotransferase class III-fold pyridoxal phosphate-dependent enzyme [Pirellulales bacterium]
DSFDAHAHLYPRNAAMSVPGCDDREIGFNDYRTTLASWMGDNRPAAGLFFANPTLKGDMLSSNEFVGAEVAAEVNSRMLWLIRPDDSPQTVAEQVVNHPVVGFKVYHVFAAREDTFNAEVPEFLPEWAWEMADRRRWTIMLHIVRPRALADPVNTEAIRKMCSRYRSAHVVLAHAARGFCGRHTEEGIATLAGLDNVYFDTSAICESEPFEAILREFGPRRLLFGTDFPVSEVRGRCVSVGDGFAWLDHSIDWTSVQFAAPTLVGIESLLALKQACRNCSLSDGEIEAIFGNNARQLLRIDERRPAAQETYRRAKQIIPGGTQLLSKRPEMHAPDLWPPYFESAKGCEIIDADGRPLLDMTTMCFGACLLGYRDPDVTDAVVSRIRRGSMSTLNNPEEVDLAELLLHMHPWAGSVRYARTGGEAMAIAVRIARAYDDRDLVAFCGYHGWHDWYLAANRRDLEGETGSLDAHLLPGLSPRGVPRGLAGTALPFSYNQLDQLQEIVRKHGRKLAAVVMEPTRHEPPKPGFLDGVRDLCDESGAVLVLDEISSGWRFALGGAHLIYGVTPDIAVFAKALGNGHPAAAIVGRAAVMESAQSSFISSTNWTDGAGTIAAVATLTKMQQVDVPAHVSSIGRQFHDGLKALARRHEVSMHVDGNNPAMMRIGFDHEDAAALLTLFTARMLQRDILAGGSFYPSLAHQPEHVDTYLAAVDEILPELGEAAASGDAAQRIGGPIKHSGFARLT